MHPLSKNKQKGASTGLSTANMKNAMKHESDVPHDSKSANPEASAISSPPKPKKI